MTFTRAIAINNWGPAKFVVDGTNTANGTHSTIATALTSASSGDTIFIRPGTYTENLTLKAGVNLTAFGSDSSQNGTGQVIINGTCTLTVAGSVTISGIQLQTNSAALLAVTGTLASVVNLQNCYLNCTNNTGITFSSSSSSAAINIQNCSGNIGTTGIAIYSHSSAGLLRMFNIQFTNSGGSTTASSNSSGTVAISQGYIFSPLSTSSTGVLNTELLLIDTSAQNATCITTAGTGANSNFRSEYSSGSASSISIGAGTSLNLYLSSVGSSNTNAITGAGTLVYGNILFPGSSSIINPTIQTPAYTNLGKYKATGQPAFLGYLASTALNKTGAGTSYTLGADALTEVFDQDANFNTNGTFTAPVTGRYQLSAGALLIGATVLQIIAVTIVTSNRSYKIQIGRAASPNDLGANISILADMDAADTFTCTVAGFGEAGDTDDISGVTAFGTFMSGYLTC